jgi:prevent-host-death family protein
MMSLREGYVGVREFKSRLSHYLRRVKAGELLTITERGRVIGRLLPVQATPEETLAVLAQGGLLAWDGQRLEDTEPLAVNRSEVMVADLLVEDRG